MKRYEVNTSYVHEEKQTLEASGNMNSSNSSVNHRHARVLPMSDSLRKVVEDAVRNSTDQVKTKRSYL